MVLDQSGVVWARLSPRREDTPCLITPCLSFPPGVVSHRSSLAPQGHYIRAVPMQHMVNKAYTRWVAAIQISGHLAHAGNHRHFQCTGPISSACIYVFCFFPSPKKELCAV